MIELEFELRATGIWEHTTLVARERKLMIPGIHHTPMHVMWGSAATYYELQYTWDDNPSKQPWISLPVRLTLDAVNMGLKPLPLYVGAVDEWYGGMAHYEMPFNLNEQERKYMTGEFNHTGDRTKTVPPPMYTLSARRVS